MAESPAQAAGLVNCRLDQGVALAVRAVGPVNCLPVPAEESGARAAPALVHGPAELDPAVLDKDRASANCLQEGPALAVGRWQAQSAAARLCCQVWAIGPGTLDIARASFRIELRKSAATIFKIGSHRAIEMIGSITARIVATTATTTGRTAATTGKIAIKIFMTATTIGITAVGVTTAIGGATCGATTPP